MRTRILVALALASIPTSAFAWGPVGHRIVAETAALLIQDEQPTGWGPLLARHRFQLGVYAFVPDASFRHTDGAKGAIEGPTHYFELNAEGRPGGRGGTVPWRAAQFLRLAKDELAPVRRISGGFQHGSQGTEEARRVFLALFDLGVLSHYSGDASMPFHGSTDWNGYARGEGGIHFYFEGACVDALEPGLAVEVLRAARKHRAEWLRAWGAPPADPIALMMALLRDSAAAVDRVEEADRRYAVTKLASPGSDRKAERKPAAAGCPPMRELLVERLAKGAVATASLWRSALPEGVDFSAGAEFELDDMNLAPAYIPPDYGKPVPSVELSATVPSSPRSRRR